MASVVILFFYLWPLDWRSVYFMITGLVVSLLYDHWIGCQFALCSLNGNLLTLSSLNDDQSL